MSQSDDIKESTQLLGETIQIDEYNSLVTSDPLTAEDSTTADVLKSFTNLADSLDGMESVENIASTSRAVDPDNRDVIVELCHPSFEEADADLISQDLPKSISRRSDSESPDSEDSFEFGGQWLENFFNLRCQMDPPTAEDSTTANVLKSSKNTSDEISSTSRTVDSYNQDVLVELSHPSYEGPNEDLSKPICGLSDSESPSAVNLSIRELETSDCCMDCPWFMRNMKNKGYLIIFEVICLAFAVASCFLGAYSWDMCPANVVIPQYILFNGVVAAFSLCIKMVHSIRTCIKFRIDGRSEFLDISKEWVCAFLIGWIALVITLIEMMEFYTMSYSFHRYEENYCNETFYWCVNYKNIAAAVLLSLTAMIYIPDFVLFYEISIQL